MRLAATIFAVVTLSGCTEENARRSPVDPLENPPYIPVVQPPVAPPTTFVWAMVINSSGVCIEGATIKVVAGQRAGEIIAQRTPCDAWGYDNGVWFMDVIVGEAMTLQAFAPGYLMEEKTVVPSAGPQMAIEFNPFRAR